jgi:hypothetical protein
VQHGLEPLSLPSERLDLLLRLLQLGDLAL